MPKRITPQGINQINRNRFSVSRNNARPPYPLELLSPITLSPPASIVDNSGLDDIQAKNNVLQNSTEVLRLNKALAHAGFCSRRAADELIAAGKILVNGKNASAGQKIHPGLDEVTINGQPFIFSVKSEASHTYVLLNKPVHVLSTASDPQHRTTVLDILPEELRKKRIYPVGRLDYFSEGLILLTDDGELTFRLTHPGWHVPRVYKVKIRGRVSDVALAKMRQGMILAEGEKLAPIEVEVLTPETLPSECGNTILQLTLHQGINRQIRRMCRDLDLTILYLLRVRLGTLELGDLPQGKARILENGEIYALRQTVKLE